MEKTGNQTPTLYSGYGVISVDGNRLTAMINDGGRLAVIQASGGYYIVNYVHNSIKYNRWICNLL